MPRDLDDRQHCPQKKTVGVDHLPSGGANPLPRRKVPSIFEDPAGAANNQPGKQPSPRTQPPEDEQPMASIPPSRQNLYAGDGHSALKAPTAARSSQGDALRAWFHSDSCNSRDGLDDYDQDYNAFQPLKNIITADMRHHIERRKQDDRQQQDRRETNVQNAEMPEAAPDAECGPPVPVARENVSVGNQAVTLRLVSSGRLMIIGSEDQVIACGRRLADRLNCVLLVESNASASCRKTAISENLALPLIRGQIAGLSGFLGNFNVDIVIDNEKRPLTSLPGIDETGIDLVLDLSSPPHIQCERPPWGYFAPGGDAEALTRIVRTLPDMVGEFEKPRFIFDEPELCAHHRSRFRGCNRCITGCPANAIRSEGGAVKINHLLCQGCGLCAALCPTGALVNGYLQSNEMLTGIRHELQKPQSAVPHAPAVVFHEPETSPALLKQICSEAAAPVIKLRVEDISSLGMDIWFAALAYGAGQIILAPSSQTTPGMHQAINTQIGYAARILKGMGYAGKRVVLADGALPEKNIPSGTARGENKFSNLPRTAAAFAPMPDRRRLLRLAIEHLYDQGPRVQPHVALPSGAPFGTVRIDKDACTFCMACAQVCPTSALAGGSEQPQIRLVEARCIQCGLCRRACPEKAIALDARMVYERRVSEAPQVLNQETSFNCICCEKPFAPARLVERMATRLDGHWMYRSEQERRRLKMCRDCRLQDIFDSQHSEKYR